MFGIGKRINERKTLREQAKELGINVRGMNRKERIEAISAERNRREVNSAMQDFIRNCLTNDKANTKPAENESKTPQVQAAPKTTAETKTREDFENPKTRVSGGTGGGTIEIVVVDNGEFKTGNFYIDGALTLVE